MKNFIKAMKMLRYGLQVKTMLILSVAFFMFGLVFEFTLSSIDYNNITSGLYLAISGVYVYQIMLTSSVSSLVQTSSMKHGLQTIYPAVFTLMTSLFTFTVFVVIRVVRINNMGDDFSLPFAKGILSTAFLLGLLLAYMGLCYKQFILSLIILCIGVAVILFTGYAGRMVKMLDFANDLSLGMIVCLGYLIVLAGWILCWLFSILLYRRPIDFLSVRAALRQASLK